jgi:hypothetical protein
VALAATRPALRPPDAKARVDRGAKRQYRRGETLTRRDSSARLDEGEPGGRPTRNLLVRRRGPPKGAIGGEAAAKARLAMRLPNAYVFKALPGGE